ncbi:MAG: O-antigen ligase family protein [Clostridium sp.]|nr:O-antigen ligase family protein [Clostridium sp.]
MKNFKINISNFFINCSFFIIASVILVRPYIEKIFNSSSIIAVLIVVASIILIFNVFYSRKRIKNNRPFYICCILCMMPFFVKNAYIEDGYYSNIIFYVGSILFCICLSFNKLKEENVLFLFRLFFIFAILTSIVTWISFYLPNVFDKVFLSMLPTSDQVIARNDFFNQGMKMGLTNHYSRNAFYIILGILSSIYLSNKGNNKKYMFFIIFFLATMFMIGKRAHFLFLILSFFIAYIIYNRISFNKIIKLIFYIIVFIIGVILLMRIIPSEYNIISRLFTNDGHDISTGRFEIYENIWTLYKLNNYNPIGWGGFTRSTNYFFAGAHNDYLQLLCETGWSGLLIVLGSNLYLFIRSIKFGRKEKKYNIYFVILLYNIFFLLYSFTGLPHYDLETILIYFMLNCFLWNYKVGVKNE